MDQWDTGGLLKIFKKKKKKGGYVPPHTPPPSVILNLIVYIHILVMQKFVSIPGLVR